ncbi:MAG: penicillin-binding protein 2 [Acidimicrobiales bacterium]
MTVITLFVLGAFAALLVKLADLQAVSPDRYAERARSQRMSVETLPATRGAIVDRNGEPLVTTVTRKTIYTDPANVDPADAPAMARALAPLLGEPAASIEERLTAPDSNFQYLARKVDDEVAERVMALGYDGVYTLDEATRLKPADDLALSVIGSVDTENVGISGLELAYDTVLTGTPGEITQERSLGGDHTIPDGQQRLEPATPGSTLMLTIDRNLQQVVEKAVADQVTALSARAGTAVVMDKATGEILALASIVNTEKGGAANDEQNRAVTTTFEPGSVMKLVTMAGAIESGLVASWTVRTVPPEASFYDYTFRDDQRFQEERMTVTDILARSSNVGTMLLAKDLGEERLADGFAQFGFGRSTGIGVENEEPGNVPALADWSGTSLPTMAIGHGLTATPLQLLAAYNAIANDGEYVSPTLVHSIVTPDGDDATRIVADKHRVVSENTARQLQAMLGTVVSSGTGARAAVPGYHVAGKTGTAWKARSDGTYGSNGDRDYLATFVGFAPAEQPRFSIIVAIDEPQGGNYSGGLAAAPVFAAVARQALLSYDIPPDAEGWAQPADGTNLRARPAEAPPEPEPSVPMAKDRPAGAPVATVPGGTGGAAAAVTSTTAGANSAGPAAGPGTAGQEVAEPPDGGADVAADTGTATTMPAADGVEGGRDVPASTGAGNPGEARPPQDQGTAAPPPSQ